MTYTLVITVYGLSSFHNYSLTFQLKQESINMLCGILSIMPVFYYTSFWNVGLTL
jgi:hypothetical protein